jgi:DNA-binding MarR family transcriptional regulator
MGDAPTPNDTQPSVPDLAALVAGLSRFLSRLASIPPFQEAGLGLAEWSALTIIAGKQGINNRHLAGALGVSAQRVNQITDSLKTMGLIVLNVVPEDARKKVITVTPAGSARLTELNSKLQPTIAAALGKRQNSLARVNTMLQKTLMRIVATPKAAAPKAGKQAL